MGSIPSRREVAMKRLSVACNFDDALLKELKGEPVYEVYGKMTSDIIGGGRPSVILPDINRKRVKRYVSLAHQEGLEFNYLLNSSCLDNSEVTRPGQKRIRKLLDWLAECKVDSVTVSHPLLMRMIKKGYPFKIRIGTYAKVGNVQTARQWEDKGADSICLSPNCNREFELLEKIRKAVSCDLQLLVNTGCAYSCAMDLTHNNMIAHASQSGHKSRGFYIDYCTFRCTADKLLNPVNFIRSTWIRPEDLVHYQRIGYNNFKIVGRNSTTESLKLRTAAYREGRYRGNLLDLIHIPISVQKLDSLKSRLTSFRYFFRPFLINPFKLLKLKRLFRKKGVLNGQNDVPPVMIKNEDLMDFIIPHNRY